MARKEATLTMFAFTQYLDPQYWAWADHSPLSGSTLDIMQAVSAKLVAAGASIEAGYGIVHDKDERTVWDELKHVQVVAPKPRHVHGAIRFQKGRGLTLTQIADALGIEAQYVEKPKSGPHSWDNMLSYLVHAKHPAKHQYDPSEVVGGPTSYVDVYRERFPDWSTKGRAAVAKVAANQDVDEVVARILRGELTREQIMLTDELFMVMAHHGRRVEEALDLYGQRRAVRAAAKLARGDFATTVIFVTGASNSGKTHWAKQCAADAIALASEKGERWALYRAATSNPLDQWEGEEVMLMDDLRADAMTAVEWLLLLDPVNASPASARYNNKRAVAPRLIIITASIPPLEFFRPARQRGDVDEAMDQFMRRLAAVVKVKDLGDGRRSYALAQIVPGAPERYLLPSHSVGNGRRASEAVTTRFHEAEALELDAVSASRAVAVLVAQRTRDFDLLAPTLFEVDSNGEVVEGEVVE